METVDALDLACNYGPLRLEDIQHNLLILNINRTFNINSSQHPTVYESTRKSWRINIHRAKRVDYVLSEYRGVIRAIYKPQEWECVSETGRWQFVGEEVTDKEIIERYLGKVTPPKKHGAANPIRYFGPQK